MKKNSKEPAYLIYWTIQCLLLIVFTHKVPKKSQTASDTFSFVKMPVSVYQSSYSHKNRHMHKKRLKHENKEATEKKKKLLITPTGDCLLSAGLFSRLKRLPMGATVPCYVHGPFKCHHCFYDREQNLAPLFTKQNSCLIARNTRFHPRDASWCRGSHLKVL